VTLVEAKVERAEEIVHLLREYIAAEAKVAKTSAARRDLPPGSSRAKVTTANARWSTACEHRDRIERALREDYGVRFTWTPVAEDRS
jgi:hypothetical protein